MESNDCIARHTYGITYFIKLPNGNIKIGFVHNPQRLCERMQELYQEHGGKVFLLASLYGGESMEALMHHKFRESRLNWFHSEQFKPTPDLVSFTEAHGNVSGGKQAISLLWRKLDSRV